MDPLVISNLDLQRRIEDENTLVLRAMLKYGPEKVDHIQFEKEKIVVMTTGKEKEAYRSGVQVKPIDKCDMQGICKLFHVDARVKADDDRYGESKYVIYANWLGFDNEKELRGHVELFARTRNERNHQEHLNQGSK